MKMLKKPFWSRDRRVRYEAWEILGEMLGIPLFPDEPGFSSQAMLGEYVIRFDVWPVNQGFVRRIFRRSCGGRAAVVGVSVTPPTTAARGQEVLGGIPVKVHSPGRATVAIALPRGRRACDVLEAAIIAGRAARLDEVKKRIMRGGRIG